MDHGKLPDIDELLKNGDKAAELKGFTKVLVLVGKTGSGKSTLSKFMREDESLTVIVNEQGLLMFSDGDVTIGSKNCLQSKTFYPNVEKDEKSGFVIIDCSGFEDNRSREYDLTAAYMNKKLLDSADQMVIILVENYSNLIEGNDRTAFINNLKHLSALIKDNIDSFKNSICMIATKTLLEHSDEQAEKVVSKFLQKTERYLHELKDNAELKNEKDELGRLIKIVQFLSDDHFGWFGQPAEVKNPWEQERLKANLDHINKLVFENLECSTQFENEFQVVVAHDTVNYVIKTVLPNAMQELNLIVNKFEGMVMKCVDANLNTEGNFEEKSAFVVRYCEDLKDHLANMSKFEDLEKFLSEIVQVDRNAWADLQFQVRKLRFLHGIAKNDLSKFEEDAAGLFGRKDSLLDHVDNTLRFHKFLALLLEDDQTCCVKLWNSDGVKVSVTSFNTFVALLPERMFDEKTVSAAAGLIPTESLIADLNGVLKACIPKNPDARTIDNTIIFSGQNIVLSTIAPAIKKHNNVMHTIVIQAAKILYVDCDVNLQNTHLVIKAPQVIVLKSQRTFHFTGENGAFYFQEQAEKNTKALNGNAGFSSGSFRMFTRNVKNANLLRICSVGGDGSNGQKGCDGTDAVTPPPPVLSSLKFGEYEDIVKGIEELGYKVFIQDKGESKARYWRDKVPNFMTFLVGEREEIQELKNIQVVNENSSFAPTDGGQGGNAGAGATAGEIEMVMKPTVECTCEERENGKPGKPGLGGDCGATAAKYSHKIYDVKVISKEAVFSSPKEVESPEKYPVAKNGKGGDAQLIPILNYMFAKISNDLLENELGIAEISEPINEI